MGSRKLDKRLRRLSLGVWTDGKETYYLGAAGILGTSGRIVVTDNGNGTITLDQLGILCDGVAGRVLRCSRLHVADGTNPNTIACRLYDVWNGDENGDTIDNIPPDNSENSGFSLNIGGQVITIYPALLSGNPIFALAWISSNDTGDVGLSASAGISTGGGGETYIQIEVPTFTGGMSWPNITTIVDLGDFQVRILYLTDA